MINPVLQWAVKIWQTQDTSRSESVSQALTLAGIDPEQIRFRAGSLESIFSALSLNSEHPSSVTQKYVHWRELDTQDINTEELRQDGLPITETKMENAIDRLTSAAHPRTFERVPAGAEFEFELVYRVETLKPEGLAENEDVKPDTQRVKEDVQNLLSAMDILEKDGLGGNISRGYGRVEFIVQKFEGYDVNGGTKGGFTDDDGKPLSYCRSRQKDIAFIQGS